MEEARSPEIKLQNSGNPVAKLGGAHCRGALFGRENVSPAKAGQHMVIFNHATSPSVFNRTESIYKKKSVHNCLSSYIYSLFQAMGTIFISNITRE